MLCLTPRGLAVEPASRVGGACVGIILALLAMKIQTAIVTAILRLKALLRGLGFNQYAVYGEMLRPRAAASPSGNITRKNARKPRHYRHCLRLALHAAYD